MKRGLRNLLASIFVLAGAVLILNATSGMTGYIVFESVSKTASSLLGLVLFIGGIALLAYSQEKGEREQEVKRFNYSVGNIIDLYDSGNIKDPIDAAERINSLRAGQQIRGLKYSPGGVTLDTRIGGDMTFAMDDENKLENLSSALYLIGLKNKDSSFRRFDIMELKKGTVAKVKKKLETAKR